MERSLIIAPHPDDETLGAGGYILKQKRLGNQVFVLNMTHMKEEYGYTCEIIQKREHEIDKMIRSYLLDGYYNLNLKPAGLDTYHESEIISQISDIVKTVKPTVVILPYRFDVHSDHRVTFNLGYSCTKTFRYPYIKRILMMEVLSETEFAIDSFQPNYFVDISDFIKDKIEIFGIYGSEIKKHPFSRSKEAVWAKSILRGSVAGVEHAEAFVLLKQIE
ncbi:PIG-L family deacetylase [Acetobacterium wieringae]|uniref:PIG-L family deacetylase n=1 Tax=Acetobacterium wieringae TaxID=52694 RepID=A0A5D0WNP7_9FIRM|nr:PIG-L family deacetylase [Acetobacterium wieringae]TYC85955.1 PIG-L family deacetylase [Acetobacterium wieringae]